MTLEALDLAEQYGATIHGVHVVDREVRSLFAQTEGVAEKLDSKADSIVGNVERMAEAHDVEVKTAVHSGDPASTIVDYAEEIGADLIVMGTHGRSGVKRRVLGSVAETVVRGAETPVLTVKLPDTDVTVENSDQAREIVADALEATSYDATVDGIERQRNVWVARASGEQSLVIYLDPRTQRTSIVVTGGEE